MPCCMPKMLEEFWCNISQMVQKKRRASEFNLVVLATAKESILGGCQDINFCESIIKLGG